jgi:hypothetical protein
MCVGTCSHWTHHACMPARMSTQLMQHCSYAAVRVSCIDQLASVNAKDGVCRAAVLNFPTDYGLPEPVPAPPEDADPATAEQQPTAPGAGTRTGSRTTPGAQAWRQPCAGWSCKQIVLCMTATCSTHSQSPSALPVPSAAQFAIHSP